LITAAIAITGIGCLGSGLERAVFDSLGRLLRAAMHILLTTAGTLRCDCSDRCQMALDMHAANTDAAIFGLFHR
jgi:hypothetical protein